MQSVYIQMEKTIDLYAARDFQKKMTYVVLVLADEIGHKLHFLRISFQQK